MPPLLPPQRGATARRDDCDYIGQQTYKPLLTHTNNASAEKQQTTNRGGRLEVSSSRCLVVPP